MIPDSVRKSHVYVKLGGAVQRLTARVIQVIFHGFGERFYRTPGAVVGYGLITHIEFLLLTIKFLRFATEYLAN